MDVPTGGVPDNDAEIDAVVFAQMLSPVTTISKLLMVSFAKPVPPIVAPLGGNRDTYGQLVTPFIPPLATLKGGVPAEIAI